MTAYTHFPCPEFWTKLFKGVSENVVYPIVPNGFADHYPYFLWLFHDHTNPFNSHLIGIS